MQKNIIILKRELCEIIKEAGNIAVNMRLQGLKKTIKSGKDDFLTQADFAVSEFLRQKLSLLYPEIFFIDEEINRFSQKQLNGNKRKMIAVIDPIDGTTNFHNKNKNWAISIGFVIHSQVTAGIIYQPEKQKIYFAEKGRGAFLNNIQIHASSTKLLKKAIGVFDYPYQKDKNEYDRTVKILRNLTKKFHSMKLKNFGSQVLEIMEVATGKADFFFHLKTKPWDVAAGLIIVKEAGGKCFNMSGKTYQLFEKNILITNDKIDHNEIINY